MFIVTGGGSGIGRALAQTLANRGKRVLIAGRRLDALLETADDFPLISVIEADVTTSQGQKSILQKIDTNVTGLVHNAGTIQPVGPINTINESDWSYCLATNLHSPLFLTQQLLPNLQESGRVLMIGSGAAYFPVEGWAPYCVSKAALSMLTRCWQLEYSSIAFASVMPGIIDTPMQALIRDAVGMADEKQMFFKQLHDKEQLLAVETVALFLTWLLLDVDTQMYQSQEWDIYDKGHHASWLKSPHTVPELE